MQVISKYVGAFGLALVLAGAGVFVGCSKSNDALVDPAAGDVPTEDDTVLSPADQCFADCDTAHAASAAKFDAMDGCSEANCKLGIDDAPITPTACAPIDNRVITYNYDEVDNCLAATCCAEVTACADDPDCVAASTCYDGCTALEAASIPPESE